METTVVTLILVTSIVLQLCAAGLALWLIRITGRRLTWIAIAVAILLMVARRVITFEHLLSSHEVHPLDVTTEAVGLVISIVMVVGVATIRPLFAAVERSRTELLQSQQTLRQSEERFRQLAESIDEVFWLMEWKDKKILYVSPAYETIWRQPCRHLYDEPGSWVSKIHPEDRDHVVESFEKKAERGEYEEEYRLLHSDGRARWIRDCAFPIHDAEGRVYRMARTSEDITSRKRAEEALRASEERFRQIAQNAGEWIWEVDANGTYTYASPVVEKVLGFTPEETVGEKHFYDFFLPEEREELKKAAFAAFARKSPFHEFANRNRHKNGATVWLSTSGMPILDAQGNLLGYRGADTDITERKRAESALRENEELLRATIESTADGILVVDDSGKVIHTNKCFAQLWRIPDELLQSRDDSKLLAFVLNQLIDPKAFLAKIRELYGSTREDRDTLHFKDGRIFERYSRPLLREGQTAGRVWSFRDVTERIRNQTELARARRLEAAGQVAGQIAHDFNNLLGPLTAYPEMARRHLQADSPVHRMLDIIESSATRITEINQDLLTLSRRGHYKAEPLNLNQSIEETLQTAAMPDTVIISKQLNPELFPIKGGRAQIQRVLVNLLNNAHDAVDGVGQVDIRTDNVYLDGPLTRHRRIRKGEYVRIRITDNGAGIPPEVIDRVFDPFFTTKTTDKHRGTGLGLSIVHSVVEDHEGYVDIDSTPGRGTTISLYFPICRDAVDQEPTPSDVPRGAGQRVLVVDDDPIQRQVAQDALTELGYIVTTAASGEEALRLAEEASYDILVLDMVMDGIDGIETLRRIRASRPDQAAVLLSGYATSERVEEALELGIEDILAKPVRIPTLAVAIHRALTETTPVGDLPAGEPA